MAKILSIDLGASNGRATLAEFDGKAIRVEELHRFPNDPVPVGSTLYWDVLRLLFEIRQSISKAVNAGGFDYIGIDTWGVDFGLVGRDGRLLENPVHYRDNRTDSYQLLYRDIPKEEIYASTGIQDMQINTLHQLAYLRRERPELLERAGRMLFMPDLLNYFLTGEMRTEYTIASTSALLDARARDWDFGLIGRVGLDRSLFCDIVQPGTVCGVLRADIQAELGAPPAKVMCIASHDTASAVAAVPAEGKDFLYVICGTWSLLGTELAEPHIDERAALRNFTNEGGANRTIRYLKNIMGTWLSQECRRQWAREGKQYSYDELDAMAEAAEPFQSFIDVDAPDFIKPGDMPARIRAYCRASGQREPQTEGEVIRCVVESLALKCRHNMLAVEETAGLRAESANMVGGGIKSPFFCRSVASALGKAVHAGPVEATALGSIALQLIAAGELSSVAEARQVIRGAGGIVEYEPQDAAQWGVAYGRFARLPLL
ncbi:MAG: rhamnulokinase [Clostridiales bacterium]|jgi:rhamnulokinase/L-fuculokinase|nr:rhamnulokinase [Clostridiales bacterium]